MNSKVCQLFATFLICYAVYTDFPLQAQGIISRHYTMKDGLSDHDISSLMQDKYGFLWLSTKSGLSKFDGYKFTTYRNKPGSSNCLRSNFVNNSWEDAKGRLWIAHAEGVDLFDPKTDRFYFHWPDSINRKPGFIFTSLHEGKDGKLWISTSNGVHLADPETLSIEKVTIFPAGVLYRDIIETQSGSVWAASSTHLIQINKKTGESLIYRHDPNDSNTIAHNFSWTVYVDKKERIWIGTENGLDLFNAHNKSFIHFLRGIRVACILEIANEKFLIGSSNGLYSFDSKTGNFEKIASEFTTSIVRDNQGIIWLTIANGIMQIDPQTRKFHTDQQFGRISAIIEDSTNNNIWMLAYSGTVGIDRISSLFKSDASFTHFDRRTPASLITTICSDNRSSVWFIYRDGVLEKYDLKLKSISNYTAPISEMEVSFIDSFGNIWLGGEQGAGWYNAKTQTYERLESIVGNVFTFLEDQHQNIWIASNIGLGRHNLITGKLDIYRNEPANQQSLSNNCVFSLMMDSDKNVWVGTGGGLSKIVNGSENDTPKFIHWSKSTSRLPNDNVYAIVNGGNRTLWLMCGNMLSHFNPKDDSFRNYDHSDGLTGGDFTNGKNTLGRGLKSQNGRIFFGNRNGLIVFHPDSLQHNSFIPPVVITSFSIHDKSIQTTSGSTDRMTRKTPLENLITYSDSVKLTYQQNDFAFEFAALNFVNANKNLYKYKLEPYEQEWIETTSDNRIARYTNISPGKYTFRVIGSNNDGVWNETGAMLTIIISPPWWETWWAYTLYGLIIIGIILSWRNHAIKRIKLKHQAQHLTELDTLKARFFANISHEFRTPVTLILGPLKDLYDEASKQSQKTVFAAMIRNAHRLLRLINQLLELSKLEVGKMRLKASLTNAVDFFREISSAYESLALDRKIKYFFYSEISELSIYVDRQKMETIVHNLLSNAFKFTKEGQVILNLKVVQNKWAVIIVKDSGIGIPSDRLNKVFDRFYQVDSMQTRGYEGSGLGLALTKEFVELHHGRITVESIEGQETTFTVWIPLGLAHLRPEEIVDSNVVPEGETFSENHILPYVANVNEIKKENVSSDHPVLLIVEDNAEMRHFIQKSLSAGYSIVEAENGNEGARKAVELIPDLIICDIMMPEMDGYELCHLIKTNELTSHIPVILLTAKGDQESKIAGLRIRADDYLSKPFDVDELKLIVRNHIEEVRKLRQHFSKEIRLEPRQILITSLDEKFLTKAISIIESHMDDESFSIEAFSREAGCSDIQFYRKVKALTGQTPSTFLRTIRLQRAAALLGKNSDTVSQVAYSVGFSSLSYFNKCFKQLYGMTPGNFAASSKGRTSPILPKTN